MITIKHKCKVPGEHRFGGLGVGSKYMREIEISAHVDGKVLASVDALMFKCHDMLEDGCSQSDFSPMFSATSLNTKLCHAIYGCRPEDFSFYMDEGVEVRESAKHLLVKFKIGGSKYQNMALDFLLLKGVNIERHLMTAELGIAVLRGLHNYFKDVDLLFLNPEHMLGFSSEMDIYQKEEQLMINEEIWAGFGFRGLDGTAFMYSTTSNVYFYER